MRVNHQVAFELDRVLAQARSFKGAGTTQYAGGAETLIRAREMAERSEE